VALFARAFFVLALLGAAPSAEFEARVVKVVDGDTLTVEIPGKPLQKIRLVDIDAPERDQPYGPESRSRLAALVASRDVRIESYGADVHGRILGRVFVGSTDLNAELVRSGAAWVFRRYTDDAALIALERDARAQKRGLWALPEHERIPPWRWRHPDRDPEPARATPPPAGPFRCGDKTYCREMASCAEAIFYLEHCGATKLDGNGDGRPCEVLCAKEGWSE
jgi:endonuclease YncB( thermonuclease family)